MIPETESPAPPEMTFREIWIKDVTEFAIFFGSIYIAAIVVVIVYDWLRR